MLTNEKAKRGTMAPCKDWPFQFAPPHLMESSMKNLCLSITVLAMSLLAARPGTADDDKQTSANELCAKACNECQRVCDACTTHCARLTAEGKKEHLTTLAECQDCATCCTAAARIVARGGPHAALMCDCCARSCDQCAKACEKFPDDKHMKMCAEECRKCEAACKTMVRQFASR